MYVFRPRFVGNSECKITPVILTSGERSLRATESASSLKSTFSALILDKRFDIMICYNTFMALDTKIDEHVIETLREFLKLAEIGLSARKCDLDGDFRKDDGCLGSPAASLLFSIVDSIGAYHRGDYNLRVSNHRRPYIDQDGYVHFFILNSRYFRQTLSDEEVQFLYGQYRSNLSHNAAVSGGVLIYNKEEPEPFPLRNGARVVNLQALYQATKDALNTFIKESQIVIPRSRQGSGIKRATQATALKDSDTVIPASGYVSDCVLVETESDNSE
jgi:hypothetical protein